METSKPHAAVIGFMIAVLLSLTFYSQSGIDPESESFSRSEGLTALAGGYGGAKGGDTSIIETGDDDDW